MIASVQLDSIVSHPLCKPEDAALALLLNRLGRRSGEVCQASKTIAAQLKWCRRKVEQSIARLVSAGFLERVRDYELRTRRRFVLLWRRPPVGARSCAQSAHPSAPTPPPPYNPPVRELEKDTTTKGDWTAPQQQPDATPERVVVVETIDPVLEPPKTPLPDGTRKATPEEVAEVQAMAARVFPAIPDRDRAAKDLAKGTRLSFVREALQWAERSKATSWGYVDGLVAKWAGRGYSDGPPPTAAGREWFSLATSGFLDGLEDL